MEDQHQKIELLRALGAPEILEPGCQHQLIADALGLHKSTWSGFARRNDFLPLPLKHRTRLGEI